MSDLTDLLVFHLKAEKIGGWVREYRFHPARRWRIDVAFPAERLAVECEGGIYSRGRHVRGTGYEADLEKYNSLTLSGWRLLRFSRKHIEQLVAVDQIKEALTC